MRKKRGEKPKPDLDRNCFAGCNYKAIDWQNAAIYVIPKIFERQVEKDIREVVRYYGKTRIIHTLKHQLPYKSQELVEQVSTYLNIDKKKLETPFGRRRRIKRLPAREDKPDLPRRLFWEFRYDEIDWVNNYRTVIDRVAGYGDDEHLEEVIRYYGRERVIHALRSEIGGVLDHVAERVCDYFSLKQEEMFCFWFKFTRPGPRFLPAENTIELPQIKFLTA